MGQEGERRHAAQSEKDHAWGRVLHLLPKEDPEEDHEEEHKKDDSKTVCPHPTVSSYSQPLVA